MEWNSSLVSLKLSYSGRNTTTFRTQRTCQFEFGSKLNFKFGSKFSFKFKYPKNSSKISRLRLKQLACTSVLEVHTGNWWAIKAKLSEIVRNCDLTAAVRSHCLSTNRAHSVELNSFIRLEPINRIVSITRMNFALSLSFGFPKQKH